MADLLSYQKCEVGVRALVSHSATEKKGAVWSSKSGVDSSTVELGTSATDNGFHSRRPPVNLRWQNITLTSSNGRPILKEVSGSACTGELIAIMGPSGAGKSTLLDVLSGFTRAKVNGRITVNGAPRDMRVFRKLSCYIMQDDHLLSNLTVRESIQLAARLKIPSSVSRQDREKAVDDCMKSLGLCERQNNKASQLSGGQRKKLCIAQELVSNPPLIFLDEPTSGLDSSSCLQCVQLLKSLAEEGRTVICTIHQPSARTFELFDKLYMLANGHCIYRGSTKKLIPFLSKHGLNCPTYHNPVDFAMEVASGEHGDWIFKLKTSFDTNNVLSLANESLIADGSSEITLQTPTLCMLGQTENETSHLEYALESYSDYATSFWNQFKVLIYRSLICSFREPMATQVRFFAHMGVGLLLGLLYADVGNNASKILNNVGFLFFSLIFLIFTAMMPTVLTFPIEKAIFAREYINSWYSTRMYFMAKTVAEIPFQVMFPLMFCIIVYWMTDQPKDLVRFVLFILTYIMVSLVAESVALVIGAATSIQNAVFLAPVVTIPILLMGGFFVSLSTIPIYLQWFSCISYIRHCFHSLLHIIYALDRPPLRCDKIFCLFTEPQDFLREIDMAEGNLYADFAILLGFFFVLRFISYFVLYYRMVYMR